MLTRLSYRIRRSREFIFFVLPVCSFRPSQFTALVRVLDTALESRQCPLLVVLLAERRRDSVSCLILTFFAYACRL